jgi:hypothetical protein
MKSYELTEDEQNVLSLNNLEKYRNAIYLYECESANSWTYGYEQLMKLGWSKIEINIGHRVLVTLVKPNDLTPLQGGSQK